MMACSMAGSSSSIQVPGSQVNAERTCRATPWLRANSTERMAGLGQPAAYISSISSKLSRAQPAGLGHDPGVGGEDAGHVGVDLAGVGLERLGQRHRGGVGPSPAEEGDVAVGRDALRAADHRDPPGVEAGLDALGVHLEDLGPGVVGVGEDPGLAAGEAVGRHPGVVRAMHSRAMALRSPAVMSMSISRPGWVVGHLGRPGGAARRSPCPWRRPRPPPGRPGGPCGRCSRRRCACGRRRRPRCRRTFARAAPRRVRVPAGPLRPRAA